ncbi:MAG: PAS domain-containing protein [Nitrospiraceae bacterium]|nr:MAG: PAS domain-containing protein [Nitrospiraceae bacterium]
MAGTKKRAVKKSIIRKKPGEVKQTKITPSAPITINASDQKSLNRNFFIAGIGASAGGLEAFQDFFTHMPPDSGMAFVLVPHLDPTHKSIIGEILKKYTEMKIIQAEDGLKVRPNCIYLIPPDKNIAILHGTLQLIEPAERRGLRHPIDYFFRTLAEDQGEKAVAIILSGTGTEGTLGIKAVKGEGGLVIVQDPKTAKYDGMPRSAITTDMVDYILPPANMPEMLMKFLSRPHAKLPERPTSAESRLPDSLQKIFILVRNQTGHDFTYYKQNTIVRRIEKRMTIHQIDTIADYVTYLRDNPSEINILFKELLIRVTKFFRDPDAFEFLKKKVLPDICKNASEERTVRIWVPGCSTGEEAYSIALLLHEYISEQNQPCKIQIFATDIDSDSIETARTGLYPDNISDDISKEQLKRYFTKEDNAYRISNRIREMVVFAVQNVVKDPPFSKVDMIICRNLLIYLGPELQKKLIPLFHYALRPEGILFLGTSETIGAFSDLFSVINNKWKIFKPKKSPFAPAEALNYYPPQLKTVTHDLHSFKKAKTGEITLGEMTEKILLDRYAPPCVITDENGSILYFHGRTGQYLEPSPGKANLNIFDMAREGLRLELRAGVRKTITQKTDMILENLKVKTNGDIRVVNVTIRHMSKPNNLKGLIMIVFEEAAPPLPAKAVKKLPLREKQGRQRLTELEFELKSTREQLQTVIEELEASNEELQSTNEELQSANEELQSSNEELETSREELQSVNEELMTVNAESQSKIDDLTLVNNDMNNLFAATKIATIFLDNNMKIKRFTPAVSSVIKLIQNDIGRPLSDFSSTLQYEDLIKDAEEVLRTLIPKEMEVEDKNGLWYLMRILPYRTMDNIIDGVVVTFIDITEQKHAQEVLCNTLIYTEGIVETIRGPLLILDVEMKVLSANKAFYQTFQVSKEETAGKIIYDLGSHQWDLPKLRELLENILSQSNEFNDFEVEHDFPGIGPRKMLLNARKIYQKGNKTEMILLAIEDVTGK